MGKGDFLLIDDQILAGDVNREKFPCNPIPAMYGGMSYITRAVFDT
jgi:hypothetical protein